MHLFLRYSQKTENVTGFVSDEVGVVCFQFGTRTESPACSNGCYSGILSGFHVHAGITDVGYIFPGHIGFFHNFQYGLRIRFGWNSFPLAQHFNELDVREILCNQFAGSCLVFVGLPARCAAPAQFPDKAG